MTVAVCVWAGEKYSVDYIIRLRKSISRYSTHDLELICFTDRPRPNLDGVEYRRLPDIGLQEHQYWWYKIYLFSKESSLLGDCIYFDLDVMFLRSMDEMLQYDSDFVILQDFNRAFRPSYHISNSSLMKWRHEKYYFIWENFSSNIQANVNKYRGDQDYITDALGEKRDWWPRSWACSFKWEWLSNSEFENPMILVFHGNPKPEDFDFDIKQAREAKYDRIRTDKIYR